jgi:hypothetical protein
MPSDAMMIVTLVVIGFLAFAGTLSYAAWYSGQTGKDR